MMRFIPASFGSSFCGAFVCFLLACFSRCGSFTCTPRAGSVREQSLRSGLVFEGKLEGELMRTDPEDGSRSGQVRQWRVRVQQVWTLKTGGLFKDSVVSLVGAAGDRCLRLRIGTRYVFFTEATNDASVLTVIFPPVEMKRAVRKVVSEVLCQHCETLQHSWPPERVRGELSIQSLTAERSREIPHPYCRMSENKAKKDGKRGDKKKQKESGKANPSDSSPPAEPKLKDLRSSSIEDGKKMILKCELVSGNPEPIFKWYKNGIQLAGKNKPKSIKIKRNKQKPKKISELSIRKFTEADAGEYKCEAVNRLGKANTLANITIMKGLEYELMWSRVTAVTEQDKMSFICYLKRYHSITVSGYTDDLNSVSSIVQILSLFRPQSRHTRPFGKSFETENTLNLQRMNNYTILSAQTAPGSAL
ncbi:Pro-neuregulin-1, membrane-bound isoform [Triplophysa tibetana]|uniref:Pro-neuregulin-1, membrane-bound isoform n=1 Tax=Triplophysa tibetana TaxID=1572043 RepID=A0A5A9N323_9TELE|nr:Pro-neuregulin-1, membrane-bound isoform [Triplophysa tibetana]